MRGWCGEPLCGMDGNGMEVGESSWLVGSMHWLADKKIGGT